jgi:hypothetical protein
VPDRNELGLQEIVLVTWHEPAKKTPVYDGQSLSYFKTLNERTTASFIFHFILNELPFPSFFPAR